MAVAAVSVAVATYAMRGRKLGSGAVRRPALTHTTSTHNIMGIRGMAMDPKRMGRHSSGVINTLRTNNCLSRKSVQMNAIPDISSLSDTLTKTAEAAMALGLSTSVMDADDMEDDDSVGMARVGPNTLIQTVGALKEKYGEKKAATLLQKAGFGYLAKELPSTMTPEMNFHNLVKGLQPQIGDKELSEILFNAGAGTAAYLLRVRIPGFFQELVKILPRKPSLQLLLFAIGKAGAWTFRGSGEYYTQDVKDGIDIHVSVKYPSLPLVSNFYRGVFDYLIHTLVDKDLPVKPDTSVTAELIDCNIKCRL